VSKSLASVFPDPEHLLQLPPEELAWVILEILSSMNDDELRQFANHHTFTVRETRAYNRLQEEVKKVLVEGWAWLQRECLIAPRPGGGADSFILTRKARQIASKPELEAYRRGNLLSGMLHPLIERESKAAFLRGEYETAIFNAFKEIEVAVRDAGGFSLNDLGVALMNEAFKPTVGPLSEKSLPETEQLGLRNLFSGAIAYYKNPGSHRHFPTDAIEVAETLFFASLLLRIVERSAAPKS
jgi:uncharacterized protein (TIGR02391 family)